MGWRPAGRAHKEKHEKLTDLTKTLVRHNRVDTILLAGTDLTLLFDESNTDFPHVDCAALHIETILKALEEGHTEPKKG